MKTKKIIFTILAILIIALVAIYFLANFSKKPKDFSFIEDKTKCDLRENLCSINLNNSSKISLEISPKGIPLLTPLTIKAKTKNINSDFLEIKIYAINMNMGEFKTKLKKTATNSYEGTLTLPTCIMGNMIWNADITSKSLSLGARFSFKTDK